MSYFIVKGGGYEVDFQRLLEDTLQELKSTAPIYTPKLTGALLANHTFTLSLANKSITWKNVLPYAVIQDTGGTVPAVEGKLMVAYIDGAFRFFTKRKTFNIKGKFYVSKTVDDVLQTVVLHWKGDQ